MDDPVDGYVIPGRNVFRESPADLLTVCRAKDTMARQCDLQALTDCGLLYHTLFAFASRTSPDYFYTVCNRSAAAAAVQAAVSPRYVLGACPIQVWTDQYWVPVGSSSPTMTTAEMQAMETLKTQPLAGLAIATEGRMTHQDASRLLAGIRVPQWHYPVDTHPHTDGLMTVRQGDDYRVVRGARLQAFVAHPCRKASSVDILGSVIHKHYSSLAAKISWGVRRASGQATTEARDVDGIWDPDVYTGLSYFNHSVLLGLAAMAGRQGLDVSVLGNETASDYVTSIVAGRIPNIACHPPSDVCQRVLMCHTMVLGESEVWRGWATALPHKGIGYGCQSISKKWENASLGGRQDYKSNHGEHNLSFIVNNMVQSGIGITSNRDEVVACIRNKSRIPVPFTYSPNVGCEITCAAALLRPQ
jgi:hypothetical protein